MDAGTRCGGATRPDAGERSAATTRSHGGAVLELGLSAVLLAAACVPPAVGQVPGRMPTPAPAPPPASMQALSRPAVTPVAMSAVRPDRGRAGSDELRASLSWRGERERPRELGTRRLEAARQAFRGELREEALHFSLTSPWANVADEMLDDPYVREAREDAARDVLGDAAEEALATLLFGRRFRERAEIHVLALSRSGLRIDDTPSWTVRRQGDRSTARFDVPLTPSSLRFRYLREPTGKNRPDRIGASVALDPWDEEARVVFSVEF